MAKISNKSEAAILRQKAENDAEKYAQLYDFASSGYFTISPEGEILEMNFAGAKMLGKDRSQLKNRMFNLFISFNSKPVFLLFLEKVLNSNTKESCELTMLSDANPQLILHLTGIVSENGANCFITAVDITERKLLEEKLKESEERLSLFFAQSLDGFFFMMLDQYGATEEQYLGLTPADAFAHYIEQGRQVWKEFFDAGHLHIDTHEKKFDGTDMIIEGDYICLYDDQKRIAGHFGIQREVTEARSALEALRKSRSDLREYFENDISADYVVSVEGEIFSCNKTFLEMFGFENKSLTEKFNITDLYKNPDDRKELLRRVKQNGKVENYEVDYLTKDGRTLSAIINAIGIFNVSGELVQTRGYIVDITERKKAESSLLKLSRAVEQSPVSIVITDKDGNIEYGNPKIAEIIGYLLDELIGKNPRIFKSGEKPKSEYKILWDTISSGKQWFGEFHNKKKNGELYWEYASIFPIINEKGEIIHYVAVKEDITGRKKIEKELSRSEQELKKAQQITHIGSWYLDIETDEVVWTEELYKMYCFDPALPPPPYTEHMKLFTPESWELLST